MTRTSTGLMIALVTAVISGVAVFLNSMAVKQIDDPALFTTLKNGVAALALLALAATVTKRSDLAAVDGRSWLGLGVVGLVGGGVAFLLFFTGLALASAPSAAFIHKTLFIWVALIAVPVLRERLGALQIAALGVLLGAQLLIAPPTGVRWGIGETMIAAATLLWACEVVIARRLLTRVPVAVLGVGRLGVGLVVLVGYLALQGRLFDMFQLAPMQWAWVLGSGLLLAGYVGTWFTALSRAPATAVSAVLVVGAPITAALSALAGGPVPSIPQLAGHLLLALALAGGLMLIRQQRASPAVS